MKLAGKELTAAEKRAGMVGAALVLGLAALGNYPNPSFDIEGAPRATTLQSGECTGRLGGLVLSHTENGPLWRVGSIEKVGPNPDCAAVQGIDTNTQMFELSPGMSIDVCNPNKFGYQVKVSVVNELGTTEGTVPVSDEFHHDLQQKLGLCLPES